MTILSITVQILITILGALSAWYIGCKEPAKRKFGFILSIIAQPLWLLAMILGSQWFLVPLNLYYSFTAVRGYYNLRHH